MIKINKQSIKTPALVLSDGTNNIDLASIDNGGRVNVAAGSYVKVLGINAENKFTESIHTECKTWNVVAQNINISNGKGVLCSATALTNTLYVPKLDSDKANLQQLNVDGTLAVKGDITLSVSNTSLSGELSRLESSISAVDDKQDWTISTLKANSGTIGPVEVKAATVQSSAPITTPGIQAGTGAFDSIETAALTVDELNTTVVNAQELTAATGDINTLQAGNVNTSTLTATEATVTAIHTKSIKADVNGLTLYGLNSQYDYLTFKDARTALASKRDITIKHTGEQDSSILLSEENGISLATGETTIHNVVQEITNIQSSIIELTGLNTSVVQSLGQQILDNTSNITELSNELAARTLYVDTELETINTNLAINTDDIYQLSSVPDAITIGEANPTNPSPGTNEFSAFSFGKNVLTADGVNKPVRAIEMTLQNSSTVPTYLAIYNYDRAWSNTGSGYRLLAVSKPVTWNVGDVVRWEFETPVEIPAQNYIQMYFLQTSTPPENGTDAYNLDSVYVLVNSFGSNNRDWGHRYANGWYFTREWDIKFIFAEAGRVYNLENRVTALEESTGEGEALGYGITRNSSLLYIADGDENTLKTLCLSGIHTLEVGTGEGLSVLVPNATLSAKANTVTLKTNQVFFGRYSSTEAVTEANAVAVIDMERKLISTGCVYTAPTGDQIYNALDTFTQRDQQMNITFKAFATGIQDLRLAQHVAKPYVDVTGNVTGSWNEKSLLLYNNCVNDIGVLADYGVSPMKILSINTIPAIGNNNILLECELWFETTNTVPSSIEWPTNVVWVSLVPELSLHTCYRVAVRKEPDVGTRMGPLMLKTLYQYDKTKL